MEEMVENQVRCMFLLEQQTHSKPLNVTSSPSTSSTSSGSSATLPNSSAAPVPEVKQKTPFNRTDKRRFSFFTRRSHKDTWKKAGVQLNTSQMWLWLSEGGGVCW